MTKYSGHSWWLWDHGISSIEIEKDQITFTGKKLYIKNIKQTFKISDITGAEIYFKDFGAKRYSKSMEKSFPDACAMDFLDKKFSFKKDSSYQVAGNVRSPILARTLPSIVFFVKNQPAFFMDMKRSPGKEKPVLELIERIGKKKCGDNLNAFLKITKTDFLKRVKVLHIFETLLVVILGILLFIVGYYIPPTILSMLTANPTATHSMTFLFMINSIFGYILALFAIFVLISKFEKRYFKKNGYKQYLDNADVLGASSRGEMKIIKVLGTIGIILFFAINIINAGIYYQAEEGEIVNYFFTTKIGTVDFENFDSLVFKCWYSDGDAEQRAYLHSENADYPLYHSYGSFGHVDLPDKEIISVLKKAINLNDNVELIECTNHHVPTINEKLKAWNINALIK